MTQEVREEAPRRVPVSRRRKKKRRLYLIPLFLILLLLIVGGAYLLHLLNKIDRIRNETVDTIDPATASIETDPAPLSSEESVPDWVSRYFEDDTSEGTEPPEDPSASHESLTESSSEEQGSEGSSEGQPETKATAAPTTAAPTTAFDYGNITSIDCSSLTNLLLVGQDRRPGESRERSDSMILVSINPDTHRIVLVSFMRDLFVDVPGYGKTRLNHAYWYGGFPLLYQTLEKNFAVKIDGGFEVDFDGFSAIIEGLDGVDLQLTAEDSRHIFEDEDHTGLQHLDGLQALEYVRYRDYGADFMRTSRQRTMLTTVFNKVKGSGAGALLGMLEQFLPYLRTDMSNGEILSLAAKLAPMMSSMSLSAYSVPASGDYFDAYRNGMSVLVPNLPAIKYHLKYWYLPLN